MRKPLCVRETEQTGVHCTYCLVDTQRDGLGEHACCMESSPKYIDAHIYAARWLCIPAKLKTITEREGKCLTDSQSLTRHGTLQTFLKTDSHYSRALK